MRRLVEGGQLGVVASLGELLRDPVHRDRLVAVGYLTVPLLGADALAKLRTDLADLGGAPDDGTLGRFHSARSASAPYARSALATLRRSLGDSAPERIRGVDPVGLVVTWPGGMSGEGLHHAGADLVRPGHLVAELAIDESRHENGQIRVVGGSHLWFGEMLRRPVDDDAAEQLVRDHTQPVYLASGHCLVMDPRLLTCALPNRTDIPKVSIEMMVASEPDSGRARTLSRIGRSLRPGRSASPRPESSTSVTERFVRGLAPQDGSIPSPVEAPNASRSWCRTCGDGADLEPTPHRWNGVHDRRCAECIARFDPVPATIVARPSPAAARPADAGDAVLVDPALDLQLRTDGWVVIDEPVLSGAEVAAVRREFERVHGWDGHGFLNDFGHRNLAYRLAARTILEQALGPHVTPMFTEHEPFLSTFLCKWPGDAGYFVPHRDWMYIDERGGDSSYLAFVVLEDVDADQGQPQMLTGSHTMDRMLRGSHLRAPWLRHDSVLQPYLEPVPLRAGQCMIWNNAIVHASLPNLRDVPRLAAGLWMRRTTSTMAHFRRLDDHTARVFAIDREFFLTLNPYRLMVFDPPYEMTEVIATGERDLEADELHARLESLAAR